MDPIRACRALAVVASVMLLQPASPARADDPERGAPPAAPLEFGGPIEMQDVFLPAQTRPQMYPERAALLPRRAASIDLVSVWANHFAKQDDYVFDGESVTTTLRIRYAPWRRVELGVDVPWTTRFDGTLDSLIEDVEDALDARVRERFETPRSRWSALVIGDDGSRQMRMLEGTNLGDVALRAKVALARRDEHGFDLALAASLGLPTGGGSFGGEGVTPGLGLHAQKAFDSVNLFGGATIQHHSDATEQDFDLAPWRWMTYAGAEWRPWRSWLGILLAYQVYGPLARGHDPLDEPAHYYAGGFRFYLPQRVRLDLVAIENLGLIENRNSTDIAFQAALRWDFVGPLP